jgi:NNP family nitrate/nitrite transporter-like MFS transporter
VGISDEGVSIMTSAVGSDVREIRVATKNKGFFKAGHLPTLFAAFLYFDLSFMVWVILGPLGVQIARDLELNPGERGLMVAMPVLAGALLRIPMGIMVDHIGPKRTGALAQLVVISGLAAAWSFGVHAFSHILVVGLVLGIAGASFAVALPLASRWYPLEYQGTALGIAGAGNSGSVLAALFAPSLAGLCGWQNVLGLAVVPLACAFVAYLILAKDSPTRPLLKSLTNYLKVLRIGDAWWFMLFYSVTFGGFVGLASSLTIYFHDQYGSTAVFAGYLTAACVFSGSLVRPVGGAVADRIGGTRTLSAVYLIAAGALSIVSIGLPQQWMALLSFLIAMLALGIGNGAVFQLIPQRFRREIGVMTGVVGMTGGVGGFYLASSLGYSKQLTGNYQLGLIIFAGLAVVAFLGLTGVKRRWRKTWASVAALGVARV